MWTSKGRTNKIRCQNVEIDLRSTSFGFREVIKPNKDQFFFYILGLKFFDFFKYMVKESLKDLYKKII